MSQHHGFHDERRSLINDLLRLIQESNLGQEIITACMEKRLPPKICAERTLQLPQGYIYQNNRKSRNLIGFESGSSWTSQLSVRSFNLSSGYQRSLKDTTLDIEFTSIFCFIISTLLVFILSLSLALVMLKCYDYFKARNTQVSRFLYSSPPSYETIAKIDRTELPTYKQACKFNLEKL